MATTSSRLLSLLSLLQVRRDWQGLDLAGRLGVSLRTVRRDVDRLRELGYPIDALKGPAGGYRLGAGTDLPPLLFDDDQAVALVVALQVAATTSYGDGLAEPALQALHSIRQVLPSRLRHRVDALQVTAVQRPTTQPTGDVSADVLLALSGAIAARESLRLDYDSSAAAAAAAAARPPRRVEPHHVVTWGGRWYLVGYDLDRADWRTYRVDRLRLRTPHGPRFSRRDLPGGVDVTTFVTGRFRGTSGATSDWPCTGSAVLALDATALTPYVHDGVVEPLGPGRCRVTLGAWSWVALAASIARFDAEVSEAEPVELREAFAQLAERFAMTTTVARLAAEPTSD